MSSIRRHPTVSSYSAEYIADLSVCRREVLRLLREHELPLPRLVWQARTAYRQAWAAELERPHVG
jgi:hypothetical protein